MNKYLKIPTHQKLGWLVFVLGFIITGFIAIPFNDFYFISMIFGIVQWAFAIAFVVEVVAVLLGKNKPNVNQDINVK
ncbi:hypothetical protein A3A66_01810 [Microgenomates group bacterium RIFCSPLOWO2_01_FULL_46_13]|nr:MAG: hypothetical protein A3A66_01810 [Microgenomates group bacterium RIFCSPLOWO2_01_FULL_46_13]